MDIDIRDYAASRAGKGWGFYLDDFRLPVSPGQLKMQIKNMNKTVTLVNDGEINLVKQAGLTSLSFTALLPNQAYPFAYYPVRFQRAAYYLNKLEALKNKQEAFPFRIVRITPTGRTLLHTTEMDVTLEEYTIVEDTERYGKDTAVEITLKQYKGYGGKIITVDTASKTATEEAVRETANKPSVAEGYTVKSGDTLSNIAKVMLGDATRWKEIYAMNQDTIEAAAKAKGRSSSSNGNFIYEGTVLKLPGSTAQTAAATQTAAQSQSYQRLYSASDVTIVAKIMYNEARGIRSKTEIACVAWTILNRVDANTAAFGGNTISGVALKKAQFAYTSNAPTTSDYGYSLTELAEDVLIRWCKERAGHANVGRVLPKGYYYYYGSGGHNHFYNDYSHFKNNRTAYAWNYSLPSPY